MAFGETLERAFGFRRSFAQMEDDGSRLHAELVIADGIIMIGTEASSKGSPGIYVVVDDVDTHHVRAMKDGATPIYGPEPSQWSTRRHRVTDPEGHE